MAGRRPVRKGNFSGSMDELVKHFPDHPGQDRRQPAREDAEGDDDVHDQLFQGAGHGRSPGHRGR